MAKLILLNTTSGDLGDTTLLCMTLCTFFKISTASEPGNQKCQIQKV
jgi:hypothetical protein